MLASGADQQTAMELASQLGDDFLPLVDRALMAIYRRQQELAVDRGPGRARRERAGAGRRARAARAGPGDVVP